mgnify:CR=1 FL=1
MSFADILASMGETGELGENPRLSLDAGEAKERRIRPGTGDAGEQFAPIRPAFAQPNPAPINEIRPIRPIRPDETEKHWCWWVAFSESEHLITYHHPPASRADVLAKYSRALVVEPFEPQASQGAA